ncbi:MAG: bifunctional 3'-5' exonuclease/DNA polymerase [Lachnospiraceae bacterium]|nr:bifunctional 3'-5' exonuclease/DNA polymerase [Lachnospiraceae bacterium]
MEDTNYRCVTDPAELSAYLKDAPIVGFDYETSPNEGHRDEEKAALDPAKSHIVGCSFSVAPNSGIYVPIAHKVGINMDPIAFFSILKKFLTDMNVIKVAHNIAFESMFSYAKGIIIQEPVYDTICASQMTLSGNYKFRTLQESGLKMLAGELLNTPLPTFTDVTDGRHFDELDAQDKETVRYGAADSDYALRLYYVFNRWFDKYLPKHRTIVETIESPAAVYLGLMKYNGVPVDIELFAKKGREAESAMEEIRQKITFIIGDVPIGANASTQAFKNYLFKDLGLPILKTTAKEKEAADDQTMQLLKEWCDENRPELSELFTLVQEYRKWSKIKSTYIDGYMKWINDVTHRIHPSFYQLSTETGRLNCQNPNCQNMPRSGNDPIGIRKLIKAPDGYSIMSLDFSQIELRVGAFYCRDEKMMQTYREGGDIHAMTTSVIFGISYEQAKDKNAPDYKERRSIAKNTNFGVFYGLFPRGLQNTLKFKAGVEKSYEECQEIIDNLKAGYPALTSWQSQVKADAARRVYSETWLGRRRYLPKINSDEWSQKSFAERCSMNTPIQGTAADILKQAMARILKGLPERNYIKPCLQIHDELCFIVPTEKVEEAVNFVRECMQVQPFPEFDLPLIAEASAGDSFGTMVEFDA